MLIDDIWSSHLYRTVRLDVLDGITMLLSPYSERYTNIVGAIFDPDRARLAAPLDDAVQAAHWPFSWGARNLTRSPGRLG